MSDIIHLTQLGAVDGFIQKFKRPIVFECEREKLSTKRKNEMIRNSSNHFKFINQ